MGHWRYAANKAEVVIKVHHWVLSGKSEPQPSQRPFVPIPAKSLFASLVAQQWEKACRVHAHEGNAR
jgi:hypothetical protein